MYEFIVWWFVGAMGLLVVGCVLFVWCVEKEEKHYEESEQFFDYDV